MEITGSGGSSYAQVTEKLKAKAQDKGRQLSGQRMPTVLAIASDHAFASLLMSNLAAEYLMTSAPQIKVPFGGGGQSYITHDFKHSAFRRNTGLVSASGAPIIKPTLQSISAILLVAIYKWELRFVGLLHPDAANPFDPACLPMIPFVKLIGLYTHTESLTEWVQADQWHGEAIFPHRQIR